MTTVTYPWCSTTKRSARHLRVGFKRGVGRQRIWPYHISTRAGQAIIPRNGLAHDIMDIPAKVQTVEYDPNRSGFIGPVAYANGAKR